jgi:ketosteroid isomerase-like protein
MRRTVLAFGLAFAASILPQCVFAQNPPDVAALLAPIKAWADAFSTHQLEFPSNAFTEDCVVIDNFPPFLWATPGHGVRQWYANAEGAHSPEKRQAVVDSKETIEVGTPVVIVFSASKAYLTFSAKWHGYSRSGKRFFQTATFTVVERLTEDGWRIEAHSWGELATLPN